MSLGDRIFRRLLRLFPVEFRADFGDDMTRTFNDQRDDVTARGGSMGQVRLWKDTVAGILATAPREHWDVIRQDVRYGLRALRHSPLFTATCVVTLALGIGANTALFSVVDRLLLRPLPYPEPERLVRLFDTDTRREERVLVSPADLTDWQQRQRSFTGVASWSCGEFALGTTHPESMQGRCVSTNYFEVLGVGMRIGRAFQPDESTVGRQRVVILSYGLWQTRFSRDTSILGREIVLNGEPHTIVGVLPEDFEAVDQFGLQEHVQVFVPLAFSPADLSDRGSHNFNVVARLRADVSIGKAQADMDTVAAALAGAYPMSNANRGVLVTSLNQSIVRNVRSSLMVLFGATMLILLLACANVANLVLARSAGQQREVAVRSALGASRLRIVRALITQNLLLGLGGGALAIIVAYWSVVALRQLAPGDLPRVQEIALNGRVLAFTLAMSMVTGLLVGLLPVLQASGIHLSRALTRRGVDAAGATVLRWRDLLMVSQVALSLVLLLAAGLLLKSFARLLAVDLGYQPDRLVAVRMFLPSAKYPRTVDRIAFYDRVAERVAALPGVEAAAFASNLPLRLGWGGNFTVEHALDPARPAYQASFQLVSSDYFRALDVPLREGRFFTSSDRIGAPLVVIVNETTAHRLWPNGNAIGSRLKKGGPASPPDWRTVVGVVEDVRLQGPASSTPLEVYYPSAQADGLGISPAEFVARTAGDPLLLIADIRSQIWSVDPEQPLSHVETLDQSVTRSVAQPRFNASLLLLFASLALALALLGIYGVVAYAVAQRTSEIGLRIALGAQSGELVTLVLRRVLGMVGVGIVLGVIGAYMSTKLLEKLLFGVQAQDASTFFGVIALLTLTALMASYLPARRIARVDPATALRSE